MNVRCDYLSPLPPVRSGIADYSVDLLAHLREQADVRVLAVEGQLVRPDLRARYELVPDTRLGEDGRLPWYQLGNNVYHRRIFELACRHPGVVTLHDLFLHHLLVERTLAEGDLGGYVQELWEEYGWIGGAAAMPPRYGVYATAALFSLPANGRVLASSRGVLVHSDWARRRLLAEGVATECAVVAMPMPVPEVGEVEREQGSGLRRRLGVPPDALLLGSYGFQTPIKRTSSVIRALALPGMETVHLLVVGSLSKDSPLAEEAAGLGVADRLHLLGYLPEEDLVPAILACDVGVNLRFPTAGETSASLLRILALGRPSLVSDFAQFREVPQSVALRVSLGADPSDGSPGTPEVYALAEQLVALAKAPDRLRDMGEAARQLVRVKHDPRRCAADMLAAIVEFQKRPAGTYRTRTRRVSGPTSRTYGWLPGTLEVGGWRQWEPGERREITVRVRNSSPARWLAGSSGPGGVMFEIRWCAAGTQTGVLRPWPSLGRDLDPGEVATFLVALRRPLGPARLRVEPHLIGAAGFSTVGGPVWEHAV